MRVALLSVGVTLLLMPVGHYVWFRYGWMTIYPLCVEIRHHGIVDRYVRGKLAPHFADRFSYWLARGRHGPVRRPDPNTIQLRPIYVVGKAGYLFDIWDKFDSGVEDYGAKRTGTDWSWDRVRYRSMDHRTVEHFDRCTGLAQRTIAREESWEVIRDWGRFPYNILLVEPGWWFMFVEWLTIQHEPCDLCVDPKQKPDWLTGDWQPLHRVGKPVVTR